MNEDGSLVRRGAQNSTGNPIAIAPDLLTALDSTLSAKFAISVPYAMMELAKAFGKIFNDVIIASIGAPSFPPNRVALISEKSYLEHKLQSREPEAYGNSLGEPGLRYAAMNTLKIILAKSANNFYLQGKLESPVDTANLEDWDERNLAFINGGGMMGSHLWLDAQYSRMKMACACGAGRNCEHCHGLIVYPRPFFGVHESQVRDASQGHLEVFGPNVLAEKKIRLTPEMLEASIQEGKTALRGKIEKEFVDGWITEKASDLKLENLEANPVAGFFFCDPSNPMGTTMGRKDWRRLLPIFLRYPDVPIFVDEAHCGTVYDQAFMSILVACPEIAHRITICRSITKEQGLTAHRICLLAGGDTETLSYIGDNPMVTTGVCPPISAQVAMTAGLYDISLNGTWAAANYYGRGVMALHGAFSAIGCQTPIAEKPSATFCYIADMTELFDLPVPDEYRQRLPDIFTSDVVINDVQAALYLALEKHVFVTPLSGMSPGIDPGLGYVRITVPGDLEKTQDLSSRVAELITSVREYKKQHGIELRTGHRVAPEGELQKIKTDADKLDQRYQHALGKLNERESTDDLDKIIESSRADQDRIMKSQLGKLKARVLKTSQNSKSARDAGQANLQRKQHDQRTKDKGKRKQGLRTSRRQP